MLERYTNTQQQQQQLDMNSTFQSTDTMNDSTIPHLEEAIRYVDPPLDLSLKETIVEVEKPIYVPCENPEEDHDEENPKSKETDVGDEYDKNCYELNDKPITEVMVTSGEGSDDDDKEEDGDGPWRQNYPADFSVWPPSMLSRPVYNICEAVTKHNLWGWMRDEDPPADEGYCWWRHPNIGKINSEDAVNGDGHSGCSFACSMRGVQFIAKHGYETWASEVTKSQ